MMKRTLIAALSLMLLAVAALILVGCGQQQGASSSSSAQSAVVSEAHTTLVVYFSATGNTEAVAKDIVDDTGADVFVIEPQQAYSEADLDYRDSDSRVSKEHDDLALRDIALVQATPDNWDEYQTIVIGYPIWWGEAAWPVSSFVKANDFAGKIVIPFCTSASSGLGKSAENLADLGEGGTWLEGKRFPSGVSSAEVLEWVDGLDLED